LEGRETSGTRGEGKQFTKGEIPKNWFKLSE